MMRGGPRGRRGGRLWSALLLVAAVVVLAAGGLMLTGAIGSGSGESPRPPQASGQAPTVGSASSAPPQPGPAGDDAIRDASPGAMAPRTLRLGRIGITAPIGVATVPGGVLTPPDDVSTVGIWTGGAALGDDDGTTLLAGHVNLMGQGPGALFDLARMRPGDIIYTSDNAGATTEWRVTAVTERPKTDGVEPSVFDGPEGPRRLAVVTCGGELTYAGGVGDYTDNVYLYAEPVR
ncbi:class F sortase [Tomitella gaofuii]|uniref:class F sortase n=1 Tax=Tomitella gaofuii TaxID=2760083 RepID=UPI001F3DCCE0|nr:class F sortase [Tomitella gaofuii]